jgi:DNA-binding transcriptional LysR family regulator
MEIALDRMTSLAVFVAAVEEGSLAAAARRFGLSAAMAGKHLSAVESDLNARLLQRTTRRLNLTDVGQTYYRRCKRILEEFDEANREASDAQGSARGLLKIAAPVTFGAMHLGDVVGRYLEAHPKVNVEILLNDHFVDLIEAGVDLAVRIGRLPDSDLVARRLAPCRMVACASPTYLARHGTPRSPEDLRQRSRLAFSAAVSSGDWTFTDADGRAHVIEEPPRMLANNVQMLLNAAIAGAGIAYGPTFVFGEQLARGELVALLPEYRTSGLAIHAVYPTARHVSLKARRFIDDLAEAFGANPPWDRWTAAGQVPALAAPEARDRGAKP